MTEMNVVYKGGLRCEAAHEGSGAVLLTDAPKDNHGKGESFSPTDLVATALGTCILTVMGIAAQTMGIDLGEAKAHVTKTMAAKPLRRVAELIVMIEIPAQLTDEQKQKLEKAAITCPVHESLHPDIAQRIEFRWG